ncbi:FHA domain-containing protein [Actinomycetota bacterium]
MSAVCPNGHTSEATDYCDTCGAPMSGAAAVPDSATPPAPAAPAPAPEPEPAPKAATRPCPHCGVVNPEANLFCEACGYDFTTGTPPRDPSAEPAEAPAGTGSILDLDTPLPSEAPATEAEPASEVAQPEPEAAAEPQPEPEGAEPEQPAADAEGDSALSPNWAETREGDAAPEAAEPEAEAAAGPQPEPEAAEPEQPAADAEGDSALSPNWAETREGDAAPEAAEPEPQPGPEGQGDGAIVPNWAKESEGETSSEPEAAEPEAEQPEPQPEADGEAEEPAPEQHQAAEPEPEPAPEVAAPAPAPRRETPMPSSLEVEAKAWAVEVWIDPDWHADQESAEECPSPGIPDVVLIERTPVLIGRRSATRNVRPDIECGADSGVSRRHAALSTDGTRWWIEDLGSSNGTFVGLPGAPLPTTPIAPGQRVEISADHRIYLGAWTRLSIRRSTESERSGQG